MLRRTVESRGGFRDFPAYGPQRANCELAQRIHSASAAASCRHDSLADGCRVSRHVAGSDGNGWLASRVVGRCSASVPTTRRSAGVAPGRVGVTETGTPFGL